MRIVVDDVFKDLGCPVCCVRSVHIISSQDKRFREDRIHFTNFTSKTALQSSALEERQFIREPLYFYLKVVASPCWTRKHTQAQNEFSEVSENPCS